MAIFQRAYDELRTLDGSIGDYIFVGMVVDPYPEEDEWHEEDEDYIELHFHNLRSRLIKAIILPCTKTFAREVRLSSGSPCVDSTWGSLGICDEGCSKVNFDYWMQIGELGGYSEGE